MTLLTLLLIPSTMTLLTLLLISSTIISLTSQLTPLPLPFSLAPPPPPPPPYVHMQCGDERGDTSEGTMSGIQFYAFKGAIISIDEHSATTVSIIIRNAIGKFAWKATHVAEFATGVSDKEEKNSVGLGGAAIAIPSDRPNDDVTTMLPTTGSLGVEVSPSRALQGTEFVLDTRTCGGVSDVIIEDTVPVVIWDTPSIVTSISPFRTPDPKPVLPRTPDPKPVLPRTPDPKPVLPRTPVCGSNLIELPAVSIGGGDILELLIAALKVRSERDSLMISEDTLEPSLPSEETLAPPPFSVGLFTEQERDTLAAVGRQLQSEKVARGKEEEGGRQLQSEKVAREARGKEEEGRACTSSVEEGSNFMQCRRYW